VTGQPNGAPFPLRYDYVYDGVGRLRVRKGYYESGCTSCWQLYQDTAYIYDGMRVIQERDGTNAPQVSYTRGTDLSGTLERAGGIGGLLARSSGHSAGSWSTHNYYYSDGNGNVTYMLSSGLSVVATYTYDPFGNMTASSGTLANANTLRFSSKMLDSDIGLYYYGFRWYDPSLQRWISRDPKGEVDLIHLYSFVGSDPINVVDPEGTERGALIKCPRCGSFVMSGPSGAFSCSCGSSSKIEPPEWHRNRNRNQDNLCPKKEPKNNPRWKSDFPLGEVLFHSCNDCYRGTSSSNSGAQCCYDQEGDLVTGPGGGSYDYFPPGSDPYWWYWHLWLDMFPSVAYGRPQ